MPEVLADIGLIGLAVMGQNLALNIADHGFTIAVFNRTTEKVDAFLQGPARGTAIRGTHTLKEFVAALKLPRKILLMVKAGSAVDAFIELLLPLLSPGDIIIDGGNSLFSDTTRRCHALKERGIAFVGAGISGGEEGARFGPSIMPGGEAAAWPYLQPIFQAISAKTEGSAGSAGEPCCDWVGQEGAGHYVKMVHNGIEYGDMQLICEAYDLLRRGAELSPNSLHSAFTAWNASSLNSYLIEITAKIFSTLDADGTPLLDKILDVAGQKGTGKWTVIDALEKGSPLTLIAEAVFSRCLSSMKGEREAASALLAPAEPYSLPMPCDAFVELVRQALYAAKIISYAQGFMLMRAAAEEYKWQLNYGAVALMWRGGCIIRSSFLGKIKEAFEKNGTLQNLLLDDFFAKELCASQQALRHTVANAALLGIPVPCLSSALAFYDGYRSAKLPANLLQAQRDFFGAHTYERIDKPRATFFHTNWTGSGGAVSSSSYNA